MNSDTLPIRIDSRKGRHARNMLLFVAWLAVIGFLTCNPVPKSVVLWLCTSFILLGAGFGFLVSLLCLLPNGAYLNTTREHLHIRHVQFLNYVYPWADIIGHFEETEVSAPRQKPILFLMAKTRNGKQYQQETRGLYRVLPKVISQLGLGPDISRMGLGDTFIDSPIKIGDMFRQPLPRIQQILNQALREYRQANGITP